jgi:hypothetical protein
MCFIVKNEVWRVLHRKWASQMSLMGSSKAMISFRLPIYDQAHGRFVCVFNKLAGSYDQAHGPYGQAHGGAVSRRL